MSIEGKYPNTAAGALQMLADESTLNLDGATATPDASVEGVWWVKLPNERCDGQSCIASLAGYKNEWGQTRTWNDWESA